MKLYQPLLLALVVSVNISAAHAQPDLGDPPKAANPTVQNQGWSKQQAQANFDKNLRDYLETVGIETPAAQEAVAEYFRDATTFYSFITAPDGVALHNAATKLAEAYFPNTLTDKVIAERLLTHEKAMDNFAAHRQKATETLERKIKFRENPRLRAALLLIGVDTDAPPCISLDSLYAIDAENPPRDNLERWKNSIQKTTSSRWIVRDDPAYYEARKRWILKRSMQRLMNEHEIADKPTQDAVVTFVMERERATQDLAVLAVPLYEVLTQGLPALKLNLDTQLTDYEEGLTAYTHRIQAITESLQKKTDYTSRPRLEAILYMKGGLGGVNTTMGDRANELWHSKNYWYLFGRKPQ
jgi:hypothetical protein